ncbi:hypothetical protein Q7P37_010151 [Cladosporium fusiforme]
METGPSPYRRKVKSPGEHARRGPECSSRSTESNTDGAGNQNLGRSINQALQLPGGKKVKAFVLMALHDDGGISTHKSNHVEQCTDQLFRSDAEDVLRLAHRQSMLSASSEQRSQEHDLLFPSNIEATPLQNNSRSFNASPITHPNYNAHETFTPDLSRKQSSANNERRDPCNTELADATALSATQPRKLRSANPQIELQSLLVCESSKIEEFITRRLRRMQQLAVKRIAKAWIKGICPKKQAIFPYHKKKREREGRDHASSDIPGWWPPISECRFVEPDHIKRDERINLCLHLLRLRPDPAKLKEWNEGSIEPHQTHLTKGWTEFLMELAPPSIFVELRESDDKTQHRQKLLAQIYELASREEDFERGDIDANDRYWYQLDMDDRPHHKGKTRRSSEISNDESGTESTANSVRLAKKPKRASETTTPARSPPLAISRNAGVDYTMQDCKPAVPDNVSHNIAPVNGTYMASPLQSPWENYQFSQDSKEPSLLRSLHENGRVAQGGPNVSQAYTVQSPWVERSSPASFSTSIDSGHPSVADHFSMEHPDYQCPQTSLGSAEINGLTSCSLYTASQFPQPQFDDGQGGTPYAPTDLTNSPHSHTQVAVTQPYNPGVHQIQPGTASSEMFLPGAHMQVQTTTAPSFRPIADPENETPYSVDPTNYYQQPEAEQMAFTYPEFRPVTGFQNPARVERGFTGHASGVGGGAFT